MACSAYIRLNASFLRQVYRAVARILSCIIHIMDAFRHVAVDLADALVLSYSYVVYVVRCRAIV